MLENELTRNYFDATAVRVERYIWKNRISDDTEAGRQINATFNRFVCQLSAFDRRIILRVNYELKRQVVAKTVRAFKKRRTIDSAVSTIYKLSFISGHSQQRCSRRWQSPAADCQLTFNDFACYISPDRAFAFARLRDQYE